VKGNRGQSSHQRRRSRHPRFCCRVVVTALNGDLGFYACEAREFDIIITVTFMPFRDGLDITREITKL